MTENICRSRTGTPWRNFRNSCSLFTKKFISTLRVNLLSKKFLSYAAIFLGLTSCQNESSNSVRVDCFDFNVCDSKYARKNSSHHLHLLPRWFISMLGLLLLFGSFIFSRWNTWGRCIAGVINWRKNNHHTSTGNLYAVDSKVLKWNVAIILTGTNYLPFFRSFINCAL